MLNTVAATETILMERFKDKSTERKTKQKKNRIIVAKNIVRSRAKYKNNSESNAAAHEDQKARN